MGKSESKKGKLVVISGPSGVGKTTICKEVVRRLDDAFLSVSLTTRPISESEVDGRDYWFISREQFQERIKKGRVLEYAEVFGNMYGTPKDKVQEALKAGKTVILEIDVQGGKKVKETYPDTVMIFIIAPTQRELAERLKNRGRDDTDAVEERLEGASAEIAAAWQYYEHIVVNDELEQAAKEVIEIIKG